MILSMHWPIHFGIHLRSAAHGTLFVTRTRLELGKRAFAVAAPAAWNSLHGDVRGARQHSTNLNSA